MMTFRSAPVVLDVRSRELLLSGTYFGWRAVSLEPFGRHGREGIAMGLTIDVAHRLSSARRSTALFHLRSRHVCASGPGQYVVAGVVTPMFEVGMRVTARIDATQLSGGKVQVSMLAGRGFWDLRWWMELLGDVVPENEDVDLGWMLARLHLPIG